MTRSASIFAPWSIFFAFSFFYSATLSHNLSITHDSIRYLDRILSGQPSFHPNHLFYEPFLYCVVTLGRSLGLSPGLWTIEMFGALTGAGALMMSFLILTRSLNVSHPIASLTVIGAGFSFALWYYSVAVEIYIYLLFFLLCSFYILMEKRHDIRWLVFAALLHSIATLFHQTAILFALVPLILLLSDLRQRWQKRLAFLGVYTATSVFIVGISYFAVALFLNKTNSLFDFSTWLLGYGTSDQYWSPFGPKALLLATVGFGRALIGGHFVFAIPSLKVNLETFFSGNSLQDEIFLVRNLGAINAFSLASLSVVWVALLATAIVISAFGIRRVFRSGNSPRLWPLIAWFAPWVIFFVAWDPSNVDFWVVPALLLWMLLALLLPAMLSRTTAGLILAGLGLGLGIINGFGSIGPATLKENDFYRTKIIALTEPIDPQSLIVIGDGWPDASHLSHYTSHPLIILASRFKQEQPITDLINELVSHVQEGRRIYIWPDVATVKPDTLAFYSKQYAVYVQELLSHICGAVEFGTSFDKQLLELSCLR